MVWLILRTFRLFEFLLPRFEPMTAWYEVQMPSLYYAASPWFSSTAARTGCREIINVCCCNSTKHFKARLLQVSILCLYNAKLAELESNPSPSSCVPSDRKPCSRDFDAKKLLSFEFDAEKGFSLEMIAKNFEKVIFDHSFSGWFDFYAPLMSR